MVGTRLRPRWRVEQDQALLGNCTAIPIFEKPEKNPTTADWFNALVLNKCHNVPFDSWQSCPNWRTGIYAIFPGIYAIFPGIYANFFSFFFSSTHDFAICTFWTHSFRVQWELEAAIPLECKGNWIHGGIAQHVSATRHPKHHPRPSPGKFGSMASTRPPEERFGTLRYATQV